MLALPTRLGGLGIEILPEVADQLYSNSRKVTEPLKNSIRGREEMDDSHTDAELNRLSREVKNDNKEMHRRRAEGVHKEVTANERKALFLAEQKGSSSWLSTIPVEENGFALHKGTFRDTLAMRYGWRPTGMPSLCACSKANEVERTLSCCKGGHVIRQHNEIRDVTASLLGEVTQNVEIEPSLQPLTGEVLRGRGGSMEDAARVDVKCTARFLECTSRRIFGCEGFQSICVVQPEQADEGSVPSTRKREAKSVQPTGSRG